MGVVAVDISSSLGAQSCKIKARRYGRPPPCPGERPPAPKGAGEVIYGGGGGRGFCGAYGPQGEAHPCGASARVTWRQGEVCPGRPSARARGPDRAAEAAPDPAAVIFFRFSWGFFS